MFAETRRLQSPSGASLAYRHQPAVGPAGGIVLISHGLSEHAGRYQRFAEVMAAASYHVYGHDHRGHGQTTAADAPAGRFSLRNGVEAVITDVIALREHAALAHPGLSLILFGHSMGGLIGLNVAVDHPQKFDGVAVWNSNFHTGASGRLAQLVLVLERMFKGSDVPSAILPRATFEAWGKAIPGHRTLSDWLSRDADEIDRFLADPLCGSEASVGMWLDVVSLPFRALKRLDNLPKTMPIHLVGGGQDPATDNGRAVTWLSNRLKAAGFSHITTRLYPDSRHETLNDHDHAVATADFIAWCNSLSATA